MPVTKMNVKASNILIIRRENIGDMVCTTPLLHALRLQLPDAHIEFLATRYSSAVLNGNPDIDLLHAYTKIKHRAPGENIVALYWQRLRTICHLRRQRFDWILLPGGAHSSGIRFARMIGAKHTLVRRLEDVAGGEHEVEQTCYQLVRMGLRFETSAVRVFPESSEVNKIRNSMTGPFSGRSLSKLVGLHISARKPSQRWPVDSYVSLARQLCADEKTGIMLLWAPGKSNNALHPGDDEKARAILDQLGGLPIAPIDTLHLEELIAALSLCDGVICADGGAMHLAAGLGKPIVALFGQSSANHWRPWGVPHIVLQKDSCEVGDINVGEVFASWKQLVDGLT